MTTIRLHGILAKEFGDFFSMELDNAKDVFDAIGANRSGFKKRILSLSQQGFDYALIIDNKNISRAEEFLVKKNPQKIDLVPILGGGGVPTWIAVVITVVSVAAQILLAPEPPEPPEITQTASSLEKSFTFSSPLNRAAQGTPIPIGYGELIIGSEIIQTTLKSYPQNQRALEAFRRNPFDGNQNPTQSSSQYK